MEKYFSILEKVKLFDGIEQADLGQMLNCLEAKVIIAKKNKILLRAGSKPDQVGIVLNGMVQIVKEDADGNRMVIGVASPGEFFGEALCCAGVEESPVSVITCEDSEIMFLEFGRILRSCSHSCTFHRGLIENMLQIIAQKNLILQNRMDFLSKKTVREKVLTYLKSVAANSERHFSIPFNREELADFLCIDRTSLSRELARLKEEGVLDYWKNQFTLLK